MSRRRTHLRSCLGLPLSMAAAVFITALTCPIASAGDLAPAGGPNYQQAMRFSASNLRPFVYDSAVTPHWIGKTDHFWYSIRGSSGVSYYRVNPKLGTKEPLFDRDKLCVQLAGLVQKPLEPALLPLTRVTINDEGSKIKFVVDEFQYEYDLDAETLAKLGKAPAEPIGMGGPGARGQGGQRRDQEDQRQQNENRRDDTDQTKNQDENQAGRGGRGRGNDYRNASPDKKTIVFAKNHNLFVAEADKEDAAVALTTDGVEDYGFGFNGMGGAGRGGNGANAQAPRPFDPQAKLRAPAIWASDSKSFYITRSDARGVKELFVINSLASPRPTLEKYKYPLPGEEETQRTELYIYVRDTKKLTKVPTKWRDESYRNLHWGKNPDELRFVRGDRLLRHIEFCSMNVISGEVKTLISEGFENANVAYQPTRYLEETSEMIWWSERSGWGHFYLYDRDGKLKNAITAGPYRASAIVEVDPKNRLLYFTGNARESGESIYNQHLYSVHFDGTGLVLMDPGPANHRSTMSPSRQFLVDTHSRVDQAPVSVLRHSDGREILVLEKTDLTRLTEAGWKMPETFTVKAADGVTDLYGNIWKPFDFDPTKKYPIIVHVYPGPQQEGTVHNFSAVSGEQQLAQLGFLVIQVGHRGGAPTRSKAYHSFGYYNLRDYGLADKKSAIEQLAARHPFVDISRVGIYGHSGGGFMTAAAMMQKPYNEFFKVGVSTSGNHDNNIYGASWAERYHGLKEVAVSTDPKTQSNEKARTEQLRTGEEQTIEMNRSVGADDSILVDGAEEQVEEELPQDAAKKADDKKIEEVKIVDEKKADDKKVDEKKTEEKVVEEKKVEEAKKAEAKTKFEIHVPTNAELAENLRGRLLLVHGELDNNVHPANTLRLVDALIKANKRFDMLYLPGKRHGYEDYQPYINQRMMEYFAENLLGDYQPGADINEKATAGGRK